MGARTSYCDIEGCVCKPIWYQIKLDWSGWVCIWHCDLELKKSQCEELDYCMLDIFVITAEDIHFLEKAQEVFEQVFTQKKEKEKDRFNLKCYSLLSGYLKRTFKNLLRKCREWREFNLRWEDEVMPTMEHESENMLMSGFKKINKEKDSYFNSYNLLRYCDPKMLFELLSVSNDNIGKFSLEEIPISTEKTIEGIHLSTLEDIRSCIFKLYYLIECVYNKKEIFQSLNLSKENKDLSDMDIFYCNADASEIGSTFKSLDSAKEKEILESYNRYLEIKANSFFNYGSEMIEIYQFKERALGNKRNPRNLTDVNIEAARCQHYEKCDKESFYYLPELGIQLCFKHNFHISYLLCTEYVPLFKLDLRQTLEIFHLLQNEVFKDPCLRDSELSSKLEDLIMKPNSLEHPFPHNHFILLQNEILMNWTQCYEPSSKVRDFYDFEEILLYPIQNLCDLDIKEQANYWIPTSNYYESDPNFIKNMLKIEILEDITENKFPKYLRKKQVDSKAKEIIKCLSKDDIHKEVELNIENIGLNIAIISPQKNKNYCFTDIDSNMQMRLNCHNKSKKACTIKYSDVYEEPFEPSFDPSDSATKEKPQEENNSIKNRTEKDLDQEPKRDCQQGENNCDDTKDNSLPKVTLGKDSNKQKIPSGYSLGSIKTSSNNSCRLFKGCANNTSSICSASKKLSEFNEKEECKAPNLEYSGSDNLKISEEIDPIEKYTEEDIKDLIREAEQVVYDQRKKYDFLFKYESLSEYFINKKLYKFKLCDPNDPLLSQYDLSDFDDSREFFSDPRWKDQISISPQNEIIAKLDTGENIKNLSLIEERLCEFETLELNITEEKCETVINFLYNHFPEECQYFKCSFAYEYNLQTNCYFNPLIKLSFRVTEEFDISHWKLSQHQMMTIFQEFKHVRSLKFKDCMIVLEAVPEFGSSLEGLKVKKIELRENDYGDHGYRVNHLIEGLSQSNDFLQNFDTICIHGKKNTERTRQILKEYADSGKLDINLKRSYIGFMCSDTDFMSSGSSLKDSEKICLKDFEYLDLDSDYDFKDCFGANFSNCST
ncbi:unnamed protein product [Moneuplotes crassus]|uniref:Uncharacterized protein n=1 Tax=Euplotes crassus TaxID=5936 RepID=A0AAD2D9N9_EUPCR|nr:unnamed protein product [Moneuplotes crassus]